MTWRYLVPHYDEEQRVELAMLTQTYNCRIGPPTAQFMGVVDAFLARGFTSPDAVMCP